MIKSITHIKNRVVKVYKHQIAQRKEAITNLSEKAEALNKAIKNGRSKLTTLVDSVQKGKPDVIKAFQNQVEGLRKSID